MITLSIEQSTRQPSAGIFRDDATLAEQSWEARASGRQHLLSVLPRLANAAGIDWVDVDRFLVGLGPGSFSGIRTALAAAMGLALPGKQPLVGLPSPEALAWQFIGSGTHDRVTVIGDARRQSLWVADYAAADGGMHVLAEPALVLRDDWRAPDHSGLLVTPDWDRLADFLTDACVAGTELLKRMEPPRASDLVGAADARRRGGRECDPPQPLYLHPAVFAAPPSPAGGSA